MIEIRVAINVIKYTASKVLTLEQPQIFAEPLDDDLWKVNCSCMYYFICNADGVIKEFVYDNEESINADKLNIEFGITGRRPALKEAMAILIERHRTYQANKQQSSNASRHTKKAAKVEEALGKIAELKARDAIAKIPFYKKAAYDPNANKPKPRNPFQSLNK